MFDDESDSSSLQVACVLRRKFGSASAELSVGGGLPAAQACSREARGYHAARTTQNSRIIAGHVHQRVLYSLCYMIHALESRVRVGYG